MLDITPGFSLFGIIAANEGASFVQVGGVYGIYGDLLYVSVSSTEQSPAESVCTSAGLVEPLCVTGLWCVIDDHLSLLFTACVCCRENTLSPANIYVYTVCSQDAAASW